MRFLPRAIAVAAGAPFMSLVLQACTPSSVTPTPPLPIGTDATQAPTTVATPAAGDGSIVYVADGNVWIAGGDGSNARQLTNDGADSARYHDPTQANDGTIFALRGPRTLVKIDRGGGATTPVAELPTLENGAEGLAASPDGAHLAYTTTGYGTEIDPRFGTPSGSFIYGGTDVASPDGKSVPGAAMATLIFPSWAGATSIVASDGVDIYFDQVGQPASKWISQSGGCVIELDCPSGSSASASLSTPSISRDGELLAYNYKPYFGPAGRRFAAVETAPPAAPTVRCLVPNQENYSDPGSIAPDNGAFSFDDTSFDPSTFESAAGQGIWSFDLNLAAPDCGASSARLIVAGGAQPDWGPAAP